MQKTVGYIRVSTSQQDVQNQKYVIMEVANNMKLNVDEWISVEVSSRKTIEQRKLNELLESVSENDTVIVSELSRIGRSTKEVLTIVNSDR